MGKPKRVAIYVTIDDTLRSAMKRYFGVECSDRDIKTKCGSLLKADLDDIVFEDQHEPDIQ